MTTTVGVMVVPPDGVMPVAILDLVGDNEPVPLSVPPHAILPAGVAFGPALLLGAPLFGLIPVLVLSPPPSTHIGLETFLASVRGVA